MFKIDVIKYFTLATSCALLFFCNHESSLIASEPVEPFHTEQNHNNTAVSPVSRLAIPLLHLGVEWHLNGEFQDSFQQLTQEFFPEGQDANNWEEKLTIHYWDALDKQQMLSYPRELCQFLKKQYSSKIYKRTIHKNNKSIFFEWELIRPEEDKRHEWFRIVNHNNYTIAIRYTLKDLDRVEKLREYWEKTLTNLQTKLPQTPSIEKQEASDRQQLTQGTQESHDQNSSLFIFHNHQLNCTYCIPRNWKITNKQKEEKLITLHEDPKKSSNFLVSASREIQEPTDNYILRKLEGYKQKLHYGLPKVESKEDLTPIISEDKTIYLVDFQPKKLANGKKIHYLIAWIQEDDNFIHRITFSCVEEKFKKLKPAFLDICQSLRYQPSRYIAATAYPKSLEEKKDEIESTSS
ncbi:MAG: hypothetical protein GWP59_06685 [Chlamydiales bacterium]|nr:hypothetical protein [Chlamydiales bacterium]